MREIFFRAWSNLVTSVISPSLANRIPSWDNSWSYRWNPFFLPGAGSWAWLDPDLGTLQHLCYPNISKFKGSVSTFVAVNPLSFGSWNPDEMRNPPYWSSIFLNHFKSPDFSWHGSDNICVCLKMRYGCHYISHAIPIEWSPLWLESPLNPIKSH